MGTKAPEPTTRNLTVNRQASHFYHLLEKFEAGIELTGTEVKSIREGNVSLRDSYAVVRGTEVFLVACHVSPYSAGSIYNHDPLRDRRLLLHGDQIHKLAGRTHEKGFTIVPTRLYSKKNLIKCEIALAKGKKVYDQRETKRRRTVERETEQAIREHRRRQG